jgi:hypothetical protein
MTSWACHETVPAESREDRPVRSMPGRLARQQDGSYTVDESFRSLLRSRRVDGAVLHVLARSIGWLAWREKCFVMPFSLDDESAIRAPGLSRTRVVTDITDLPEDADFASSRRLLARGGFVVLAYLEGVAGPVGYTEGQQGAFVGRAAPASVVYSQYIWVDAAHRGKRIADDLRRAFNTHSRSTGAEVVLVQVAAKNAASRRSTLRSEQSHVVGHIIRWTALGRRLRRERTFGEVTGLLAPRPVGAGVAPRERGERVAA